MAVDIWDVAAGVYLGGAGLLISYFGFSRLAKMSEQEEEERPGYAIWNGVAIILPFAFAAMAVVD